MKVQRLLPSDLLNTILWNRLMLLSDSNRALRRSLVSKIIVWNFRIHLGWMYDKSQGNRTSLILIMYSINLHPTSMFFPLSYHASSLIAFVELMVSCLLMEQQVAVKHTLWWDLQPCRSLDWFNNRSPTFLAYWNLVRQCKFAFTKFMLKRSEICFKFKALKLSTYVKTQ